MSKFGLDIEGTDQDTAGVVNLAERLAAFPITTSRPKLDLPEVDEAAAVHGFVSREASERPALPNGRRRRFGEVEPTRHLAIRLSVANYQRFVAYADEHQLTYHDALAKLLTDLGR